MTNAAVVPHLVEPHVTYRDSFLEGLQALQSEGLHPEIDFARTKANFEGMIVRPRQHVVTTVRSLLPVGFVPWAEWWLVEGQIWLGRGGVRFELNDHLWRLGGHIGYEIAPAYRRRGHGTLICRLLCAEARKIGLERALITCDETNVGSRRIIEANGGVRDDSFDSFDRGVRKLRFWVDLRPSVTHF